VSIDYDEPNQSSYRGIKLNNYDEDIYLNSGSFLVDHIMLRLFTRSALRSKCYSWGFSSSYDHLFMDGDKYQEKYIKWHENGLDFDILDTSEMSLRELDEADKIIFLNGMETSKDFFEYWNVWKEANKEFWENWKQEMEII